MPERIDLRVALATAVRAALHDFLVTCAGQDVPDDMRLLDEYRFEVVQLDLTTVEVKCRHHTDHRWTYRYEVEVGAGK
jgi:hypothetical protein